MARKPLTLKRPRCATVVCHAAATEEITYDTRNDGEFETERVCQPCADSYARRPVLTHFTRRSLHRKGGR